jgi:hypothetical protein
LCCDVTLASLRGHMSLSNTPGESVQHLVTPVDDSTTKVCKGQCRVIARIGYINNTPIITIALRECAESSSMPPGMS